MQEQLRNNMALLENKDFWWIIGVWLSGVGILLTFIASVWNLRLTYSASRESRFINTVTNHRIQFIQGTRDDISRFCGAVHSWMTLYGGSRAMNSQILGKPQREPQEIELLKEIDRLRYLIRLRLNPEGELGQSIGGLIMKIPQLTDGPTLDPLQKALEQLTTEAQTLLHNEWLKVKDEARKGKMATTADVWTNPKSTSP